MNKRTVLSLQAIISVIGLVLAVCLSPSVPSLGQTEPDSGLPEIVITVDETAAPTDEVPAATVGCTEDELRVRFASMLNLNQCYNDSFDNEGALAAASAIALLDYAADIPGYGFCVNTCLVEGFAQSFYGVTLDSKSLLTDSAPEGYVGVPVCENGTQLHNVSSISYDGEGYEVWSTVTVYYGGDSVVTNIARSYFVSDAASEFGFNLISSELL